MTAYQEALNQLLEKQYTWLVTGAAGFIGSNLVEKLISLNQRVVGLDNFETGYQHNLDQALADAGRSAGKDCSPLFHFYEGDIRTLEDCQKAMIWHGEGISHGVDFVLHQAALGSVPRSIIDPIHTNKANIDGFLNVLVSARDANVKGFVYAASSSTYGDHPDLPKVEDKIGNPLSPYAVTKYVNELYAKVFANAYGLKTIGLRYFNIFGKRQDPSGAYAAVIPKWVASMIKGKEIYINGDGETSRDFCYIDNAIQINILSALSDFQEEKALVFNCAFGEQTTLNELHAMISERILKETPGLTLKAPLYCDFREGDVRHSLADISKAEFMLGYQPKFSIRDGMDDVFNWYLKFLS